MLNIGARLDAAINRSTLLINTNQVDSTVLLFVRPTNGVYLPPKVVRLRGKSTVEEIGIVPRDMPNIFVEALTIADGKVHHYQVTLKVGFTLE